MVKQATYEEAVLHCRVSQSVQAGRDEGVQNAAYHRLCLLLHHENRPGAQQGFAGKVLLGLLELHVINLFVANVANCNAVAN